MAGAFQSIQQGWSEMTAAARANIAKGIGARSGGTRRRRRKAKAKAAPRRRAKRTRSVKGLRKGSAAMKRHMAKLRAMRKK